MTGFLKVTVQRESGAVVDMISPVISGGRGLGVGVAPGASVPGGGEM
jgi:hypothetical protein